MISKKLRDDAQYPKKLVHQLRRQIAISVSPTTLTEPDHLAEQFEKFHDEAGQFHNKYEYIFDNHGTSKSKWREFDVKLQAHMGEHKCCIDFIVNDILLGLRQVYLNASEIVSTRNRIEHEKKIRDRINNGQDISDLKWDRVSLDQYASVFLRWLVNSWSEAETDWVWTEEDWESDIQYALRGYFLAKHKQDGSGFDIFGTKTIGDAKALAEPHIPREGIDVFINAFDVAGYDRSTLPQPWQCDAQFTVDLPNMHARNPEFEIRYACDDYLIIHLQNRDSAIAFGYGTSWCTAQQTDGKDGNYFDDYADGLTVICDKNGYRYQAHLGGDQFHNEADNPIERMELCDQYPELLPTLFSLTSSILHEEIPRHVRFYQSDSQTKSEYDIEKENLKRFASARLAHSLEQQDTESLCQLFNAISIIHIQDVRDDIWLSLGKRSISKAVDLIPDVELSIDFFIETYFNIGEKGRGYLAHAELFSRYEKWLNEPKQKPLPHSITGALKLP